MTIDYIVKIQDKDDCLVAEVEQVEMRNTTPIGGFTLPADWLFFYSVNPPTTWQEVIFSAPLSEVKSFSKKCT